MSINENFEKRLEELGGAIGQSEGLAEKVMTRIEQVDRQNAPQRTHVRRFMVFKIGGVAAAAMLMAAVGFGIGRMSSPGVDMEELKREVAASIRPAIESNIRKDIADQLHADITGNLEVVRDQLAESFRQDLNDFAVQTVAASNMTTNQLLAELIEAIGQAQAKERAWVVGAMQYLEENRLQDRDMLEEGLAVLAVNTQDELIRTRKDIDRLLANAPGAEK